jgi:glycosyltransferase involved in cell wall biosynthesis
MKVGIVTIGGYPSFGGPAKSVKAFQKALDADVVVWIDPRELRGESIVFDDAVVVRATRVPLLRQLLYPRREDVQAAADLIAACDFISCHMFWRWHVPWVEAVSRETATPFWLVPHGGLDPYVFAHDPLVKRAFLATIGAPFLRRACGMVCSTQREYDKAKCRMPNAKHYILPWPMDPTDIRRRDARQRDSVRSHLGIPSDAVCLLYLGRLHSMKRPLETISALASSKASNVYLLMIGNEYGVSQAACIQHARELGVLDRVRVLGPVFGREKHGYLDAADIFISLSHRENFNLSAAEAMGSGLPLLLSPGNDLAHDLRQVDCGWMLSSVEQAPEALREISRTSISAIERKGSNGQAWAADQLSFEVFKQRLRNYVDLAASGRRQGTALN